MLDGSRAENEKKHYRGLFHPSYFENERICLRKRRPKRYGFCTALV